MEISRREREGVTILEPRGRITLGAGEEELRDALHELLRGTAPTILVSLEHVELIDSAGIGVLVAARTMAVNRGGGIKLIRLPPMMQDMLQLMSLLTIFDVYDEESQALASIAPGGAGS